MPENVPARLSRLSKTGDRPRPYRRAMDDTLTTLGSMLNRTAALIAAVQPTDLARPTPCTDFDVEHLLEHMTTWVQVFDATVHDRPLPFDPSSHTVGADYARVFTTAADGILEGLWASGWDRMMTMTGSPLPGELVLNMLLMEYVGHGWDLARAIGAPVPFTDDEARVALVAAQAIIAPEYRGTGMFDAEVPVPADAPAMDRAMAFVGRDPAWSPASVAAR